MKQQAFEKQHETFWRRLEESLTKRGGDTDPSLPSDYRRLCQQLAVARYRHYTDALTGRLQALAQKAQARIYRPRPYLFGAVLHFLAFGFPQAVRANGRWVALSALFFFGPLITMMLTVMVDPPMVYTVLSPYQAASYERMYQPDRDVVGMFREADSEFLMFGFYLSHNTAIGLRTFASGLLFWIGTLFFLLLNGFTVGAVAGHMTHLGYINTFWGFVAGHSAMELSAIVLAGAAGLKLGFALIYPGLYTRGYALREAARGCLPLVYGFMLLFSIAALIEAYWSSRTEYNASIKFIAGIALWIVVGVYFSTAGRLRRAR